MLKPWNSIGDNIYQYSCHRKKNVHIDNGCLILSGSLNPNQGGSRFMFNSAKISSQIGWRYGKFVMRAILPEGKMLRSVLVLKPKQPKYPGDWLDNGQINMLVYAQQASFIIGGLHYRMPLGQSYNGRKLNTQSNVTKEFQLYSIEWNETTIRWLFNDVVYFEHNVSKPFDQPFHLVLQLGVGGPEFDTRNTVIQSYDANRWPNNNFTIDYIKIYQKNHSTSITMNLLACFLICLLALIIICVNSSFTITEL